MLCNIGSVLAYCADYISYRWHLTCTTVSLCPSQLSFHRIREVLHNGFPRVRRLLPERVVYLICHASQRPAVCTLIVTCQSKCCALPTELRGLSNISSLGMNRLTLDSHLSRRIASIFATSLQFRTCSIFKGY